MGFALICTAIITGVSALPVWNFDGENDKVAWACNGHMAEIRVSEGCLSGKTTSWDPIMETGGLDVAATPWQYVLLRIKTDRPGKGQLFWTGVTEGKYSGFTEQKLTNFIIGESGGFQDIAIVPGWHREGTIKKIRLDLFDGTNFSIDKIAILEWGGDGTTADPKSSWALEDINASWTALPGSSFHVSPPLSMDAGQFMWAAVEIESSRNAQAEFVWITDTSQGMHSEMFELRPGRRVYNIELGGNSPWSGKIIAVGVNLPGIEKGLRSVVISEKPEGAADPILTYFGFENGVNRAGRSCPILVQIENRGGEKTGTSGYSVVSLNDKLAISASADNSRQPGIAYGETGVLRWNAMAQEAGEYSIQLEGPNLEKPVETKLRFMPARDVVKAEYVPAPNPVKPALDVCMYYFPGWESYAKWDCIVKTAPIRKPLLGYYDERNPECVDWQIKWAVENGINCFLVDWYWNSGVEYLTHWFEAYKRSKYRDHLKVAIMWANHNPPGSHSREDWKKVTQEWIDNYFNLPGYYRINGRPAMFLWNPEGIRQDLGSTEEVRAALDESQTMARAAGYEGIEFVAINNHESRERAETLAREGYVGATNYHEWGRAEGMVPSRSEARFEHVVETAPEAWKNQSEVCAPGLVYYPVVETGWDSRPWHGAKSLVIGGRTAGLFEQLLAKARSFCENSKLPFVVLGPGNEWGEGSYVEPATEYDFEMYEAIRRVFGMGDPALWPENISPQDMGLGLYDFPPLKPIHDWTFDLEKGGWNEMMNASKTDMVDGHLVFRTLSTDPALVTATPGLNAGDFKKIIISMRIGSTDLLESSAQLFWSVSGYATSESASVAFPVITDGKIHDYTIELSRNPRWKSRISALRFDPCSIMGADVGIDRIRFEK